MPADGGNLPFLPLFCLIDPVVRSKEAYDVKIVYENPDADTVGGVSVRVASVTAFGTAAAHVMAKGGLATAIGGTHSPAHRRKTPTPAS